MILIDRYNFSNGLGHKDVNPIPLHMKAPMNNHIIKAYSKHIKFFHHGIMKYNKFIFLIVSGANLPISCMML